MGLVSSSLSSPSLLGVNSLLANFASAENFVNLYKAFSGLNGKFFFFDTVVDDLLHAG